MNNVMTTLMAAINAILYGFGTIDVLFSNVMTSAGMSPPFQFFFLCVIAAFFAILALAYIRGVISLICLVVALVLAAYWIYPPIRPIGAPTTPAIEQTL